MSCQNETYSSRIVIRAQGTGQFDRPAITTAVVAIVEAFQEALEMRRAAHRRRPFNE